MPERLCRVTCRLCSPHRTWHTADPLASWEAHWAALHARERSIWDGAR